MLDIKSECRDSVMVSLFANNHWYHPQFTELFSEYLDIQTTLVHDHFCTTSIFIQLVFNTIVQLVKVKGEGSQS